MLESQHKGVQRLAREIRRPPQTRFSSARVLGRGGLAGAAIVGSPIRGWPRWVRCTRIWWVRPVSSRHSIRLANGRVGIAEALHHAIARARRLAAAAQHRHALAVERTAADLAFDHAVADRAGCPTPRRDRRARWCDWRIAWRGSPWRARSWRRPASPLVSLSRRCTMPGRASPPMPISDGAAMGDQGVDQRAVGIAGRRMHHQAGRLVDDDEVLVLIDDARAEYPAPAASRAPAAAAPDRSSRPV